MPMRPPPDIDDAEAWGRYALLDDDRVEFGVYVQSLLDGGISMKSLSKRTGRPRAFFQQHVALASADPALHAALEQRAVNWAVARAIALQVETEKDQREALAWIARQRAAAGKAVEEREVLEYFGAARLSLPQTRQ